MNDVNQGLSLAYEWTIDSQDYKDPTNQNVTCSLERSLHLKDPSVDDSNYRRRFVRSPVENKNEKTELCPYGTVYREGCKICFCIEEDNGLVKVKCESHFSDRDCAIVGRMSHCDSNMLLHDYERECDGECQCNEGKTITTCEGLPCGKPLLRLHEFNGGPILAKVPTMTQVSPTKDNSVQNNEGSGMVRSQPEAGHPNKKTELCPYGMIYLEGCKVCYCIEEDNGSVRVKCESRYSDRECVSQNQYRHCYYDFRVAAYDFSKKCVGKCECNQEGTITSCDWLPCGQWLLRLQEFVRDPAQFDESRNKMLGMPQSVLGGQNSMGTYGSQAPFGSVPSDEDSENTRVTQMSNFSDHDYAYGAVRSGGLSGKLSPRPRPKQGNPNKRTKLCPHGMFYRSDCQICFCVELDGVKHEKCETKFTEKECPIVTKMSHCDPEKLLYDYVKKCEGDCGCNSASNITTCQSLPCALGLRRLKTFIRSVAPVDESVTRKAKPTRPPVGRPSLSSKHTDHSNVAHVKYKKLRFKFGKNTFRRHFEPDGYELIEGMGVFRKDYRADSFDYAEEDCNGDGANLMVPDTIEKKALLIAHAQNPVSYKSASGYAWVGITKRSNGEWRAYDGRTVDNIRFFRWSYYDPGPDDDVVCLRLPMEQFRGRERPGNDMTYVNCHGNNILHFRFIQRCENAKKKVIYVLT